MQITLFRQRRFGQWLQIAVVLGFVALCLLVYTVFVHGATSQLGEFRLGADSQTYFGFADLIRAGDSGVALITFSANLLGPVGLALLLKTALLVALFNLGLFLLTLVAASGIEGLDVWLFACLLIANAETVASVVTLNKEIFSLVSVILFARIICARRRSWLLLGAAGILALLARWEQLAIMLIFLFLNAKGTVFTRHRGATLVALICLMGVAYPLVAHSVDVSGFVDQAESGGAIILLDSLQAHFLYPLALLPKIAMSLFGRLLTPWYFFGDYWNQDFHDLQNQFIVHLHSLATLTVCLWAAVRGRLRLSDPIVYFIALYLVIASANPFIQPRYQYPVYALLCLVLARSPRSAVRALEPRGRSLELTWLPSRRRFSLNLLRIAAHRKPNPASPLPRPIRFRFLPARATMTADADR